ncbi:MAG: nucleotidyl transferase AbiEii/AbiGii toxin family protein, partial [Calditrichota bacterium]
MTKKDFTNVAQSLRDQLNNLSKLRQEPLEYVLTRYGLERLLYRLSKSRYKDQFILKGAMLFEIWFDQPYRATRDVDFLGFGENNIKEVVKIFREISRSSPDDEDGLEFDTESIQAEFIREEQEYGGIRIKLYTYLASARIRLQVDVGYGDAIVPKPQKIIYPTLLELPAPYLRAYQPETVIAEKFQFMAEKGIANSRMKDYCDVWFLSKQFRLEGEKLASAIKATFSHRNTRIPDGVPLGLSEEFFQDPGKKQQWATFSARIGLTEAAAKPTLEQMIKRLAAFLLPPAHAIREG